MPLLPHMAASLVLVAAPERCAAFVTNKITPSLLEHREADSLILELLISLLLSLDLLSVQLTCALLVRHRLMYTIPVSKGYKMPSQFLKPNIILLGTENIHVGTSGHLAAIHSRRL